MVDCRVGYRRATHEQVDQCELFLSQLINRDYEVMNNAVLTGAFTAVLGSILVSLDTDEMTQMLDLPRLLTNLLRYRLAGG